MRYARSPMLPKGRASFPGRLAGRTGLGPFRTSLVSRRAEKRLPANSRREAAARVASRPAKAAQSGASAARRRAMAKPWLPRTVELPIVDDVAGLTIGICGYFSETHPHWPSTERATASMRRQGGGRIPNEFATTKSGFSRRRRRNGRVDTRLRLVGDEPRPVRDVAPKLARYCAHRP